MGSVLVEHSADSGSKKKPIWYFACEADSQAQTGYRNWSGVTR